MTSRIPDPSLRAELLARAERDQHARLRWQRDRDWSAVEAVDEDNLPFLAAAIDQHGWLGWDLVGPDGAHACWLLTQHCPPAQRAAWLPLLRTAVAQGQAEEVHLAYLSDRVAMDHDRPQLYGTQSLGWADSGSRLWPVSDLPGLGVRRARLGMAPLSADAITGRWSAAELATRGRVLVEPDPDASRQR